MSNPIKPDYKTEFVPLLLLFAGWLLAFYFYRHFPAQAVVHWGIDGQPNGYAPKAIAIFFFPFLNLFIYLLMFFIPRLDPRKSAYQSFRSTYHLLKAAIIFFIFLLYLAVGFNNLGYHLSLNILVPFLVGCLFVVIGLSLKRLKPNYFFGIRTPWTLRSATVWRRTHSFGARAFVAGGLLICLLAVFSVGLIYFVLSGLAVIIVTVAYSYFISLSK